MKRIIYVLWLASTIILASCTPTRDPVTIPSVIRIHSSNHAKPDLLKMLSRSLTCGCSPAYDIFPWEIDLHCWDDASGEDSIKFENQFKAYAHDSIRNEVKYLSFSGYSSIPARFRIFKNVENIAFSGVGFENGSKTKLKGLEMFPKLKRIHFFGGNINIDSNDLWIHQIEEISMSKCQVNDFPSFDRWHNLKLLYMGYSGFDPFPRNFNSLHCLQKIMINEYRSKKSGPLDLSQMDFRYFPCLRFVRLDGGMTGIPKRLKSGRQYRLEIRKWGLTPEERKKVDPYIQHFN